MKHEMRSLKKEKKAIERKKRAREKREKAKEEGKEVQEPRLSKEDMAEVARMKKRHYAKLEKEKYKDYLVVKENDMI